MCFNSKTGYYPSLNMQYSCLPIIQFLKSLNKIHVDDMCIERYIPISQQKHTFLGEWDIAYIIILKSQYVALPSK